MGQQFLDSGAAGADLHSDLHFNLMACAYGDTRSCALNPQAPEEDNWFMQLMKYMAPMLVRPGVIS